uniref:Uncharacterized protein n=1 Tax=Candidatus Kentrum sp. FM TaxID=2126340 RepID=A0A450STJ1_9GAMM|nr:MAG: hypothetical protein BECKFM1743A_GA0114220_101886 [Candidatus Kentron sp. FM]VFJ58021.1 MAG: hypothetical protein BECKFM1743C_GA0114222_102143 [Candidatus Kentron sp. FM]VFK11827.1 MAG: hypothetical protein BECKFM1743B_GA0114221_102093 [Candidatus Kentron sp. FM]
MPNEKSDPRNGGHRSDTQGYDPNTDSATRQNGASEKSSAGTDAHSIDSRQDNQSVETAASSPTPTTTGTIPPDEPAPSPSPAKRSLLFQQAPAVYVGDYRPSAAALRRSFALGDETTSDAELLDRFGRIEVVHNGLDLQTPGASFFVRNLQFDVGDGRIGHRILPVDDGNNGDNPTNRETEETIRKALGVSEGHLAPYEIIFTHPETHGPDGEGLWEEFPGEGRKGTLKTIAGPGGVTQGSATHRGGAVGFRGVTHNSPEGYHHNQFEVKGYPAVAVGMTIEGAHPDVVASQRNRASFLLNDGVNFSVRDYKNDFVRIRDINTVLMFARDWIVYRAMERVRNQTIEATPEIQAILDELATPALRVYLGSEDWTTYCAEHRASVDYLMTALQFTEAGFREVYDGTSLWGKRPEDLGAKLFALYSRVIIAKAKALGVPYKEEGQMAGGISPEAWGGADGGQFFTPLWQRMGFSREDIRPFDSPEQYDAYENARIHGTLEQYKERWRDYPVIPLPPGKALPYGPQTNADLIAVFIKKIHDWRDVGGIQVATAIMAFMKTATERHGISPQDYAGLVTPIIGELLIADALARGAPDEWFTKAGPTLGAVLTALVPADAPPEQAAASRELFLGVAGGAAEILASQKAVLQERCGGVPVARAVVDAELDRMLANDIATARKTEVGDRTRFVKNNIPPQTLLDILHGFHRPVTPSDWNDGMVGFVYLGTLMDRGEVSGV